MKRTDIKTKKAPAAIGPYAQAVRAGKFLFTSGQLGLDPQTGDLMDGLEAQAHQAMQNLGAVLKAAKLGYGQVIKTTIFMVDLSQFTLVNDIYAGYFDKTYPARSTVQVAGLPKGGLVEIEAVAVIDR